MSNIGLVIVDEVTKMTPESYQQMMEYSKKQRSQFATTAVQTNMTRINIGRSLLEIPYIIVKHLSPATVMFDPTQPRNKPRILAGSPAALRALVSRANRVSNRAGW